MRLIDVDELRLAIRNNAPKSVPIWVYQTIDNAPTAYDPDKVVEQLEEACISPSDYPGYVVDIEKAIEIVKAAGINDPEQQEK